MSAQEVAQAFVGHYFQMRETNVAGLISLYQPQSTMTFEGELHQGNDAIVAKLTSVGAAKFQMKSFDVQPSTSETALIIFVTGECNALLFVVKANNQKLKTFGGPFRASKQETVMLLVDFASSADYRRNHSISAYPRLQILSLRLFRPFQSPCVFECNVIELTK